MHQSIRDNTERHDGLWLFSARWKAVLNKMDSELLKFIEYFPDYLSALSRTLFWTTFVETVCEMEQKDEQWYVFITQ